MHYVWMFIVGIVVGAIARFVVPGNEHMGIFMTGLLGIAGSFVGGYVGRMFGKSEPGATVQPAGIFMSVVGAAIVLVIFKLLAH